MPRPTPSRSTVSIERLRPVLVVAATAALGALAAACGNGELAAPTPEGIPRLAEQETRQFDNSADAFRFAGFEYLEPDPAQATLTTDITVRKLEAPTTDLVTVRAVYGADEGSIEMTIDHPETGLDAFRGEIEEISIRGELGVIQRGTSGNQDMLIIAWSEEGVTYEATTFTGHWSEEAFFEVIESMG